MTPPSVHIQISSEEVPSIPCWFGEVAIVAHCFTTSGLLTAIEHQVRLARPRFGTYEVLDFVVVLLGYAMSAEPTLLAFYERLTPFAVPFMALFNREKLPHRTTLSRFLAALDQPCVEALRGLFQDDLITQTAQTLPPGGLWDRLGHHWLVMDVDGTKQAARQPSLKRQSFLLLIDDLTKSVLLDIWGANAERSHEPEPPSFKRIRTTGLAHLVVLAMGITEANWHAPVKPSLGMQAGSVCRCLPSWFDWMDCMGRVR